MKYSSSFTRSEREYLIHRYKSFGKEELYIKDIKGNRVKIFSERLITNLIECSINNMREHILASKKINLKILL